MFIHRVTGLNVLSKCSVLGTFWTSCSQSNYTTCKSGSEKLKRHIHPICAHAYVHLTSARNKTYITHLLFQEYKARPTFLESIMLTADTVYSTVYMFCGYAQDFHLSSDSASGILIVSQTLSSDGKKNLIRAYGC